MNKKIKIEDFISSEELESMNNDELEICKQMFELNKEQLQKYTDAIEYINKINKNKNYENFKKK
jgi:predicted nucleic acid-binding protein